MAGGLFALRFRFSDSSERFGSLPVFIRPFGMGAVEHRAV